MPVKRFIAGAKCPACGAEDKIRAELGRDGLQFRECVACGFEDRKQGGEAVLPASRLQRPNDPAAKGPDGNEKPVRFYPRVAGRDKQE